MQQHTSCFSQAARESKFIYGDSGILSADEIPLYEKSCPQTTCFSVIAFKRYCKDYTLLKSISQEFYITLLYNLESVFKITPETKIIKSSLKCAYCYFIFHLVRLIIPIVNSHLDLHISKTLFVIAIL